MASYTIASGKLAVNDKTLVANTADTVTVTDPCDRVEVLSDGAAKLYFTVDGVAATVGGADCFEIPSGAVSSLEVDAPRGQTFSVSLVSSGAPTYSVTRAQ